jgi:hypothetical protein
MIHVLYFFILLNKTQIMVKTIWILILIYILIHCLCILTCNMGGITAGTNKISKLCQFWENVISGPSPGYTGYRLTIDLPEAFLGET